MKKIPVTVEVLTFNNRTTIERCLESIADFDDVVVLDGGSTDGTLEVAQRYENVRVMTQREGQTSPMPIADFAAVRNRGLDARRHEWFVFLDSDEYCTPELVDEIRHVVKENMPAAYWIPRQYVFHGERIDCATTYPNPQMRFFHTSVTQRFEKEVHERIALTDGAPVHTLRHPMQVPMNDDLDALLKKWDRYITIEVARRQRLTVWKWLRLCLFMAKVSTLYALRHMRIILFCRGTRLPIAFELARHIYHMRLARALWQIVRW